MYVAFRRLPFRQYNRQVKFGHIDQIKCPSRVCASIDPERVGAVESSRAPFVNQEQIRDPKMFFLSKIWN